MFGNMAPHSPIEHKVLSEVGYMLGRLHKGLKLDMYILQDDRGQKLTRVDEADERWQKERQVVFQRSAERLQACQRRPHQLVAAAALGLAKQRHKLGQQPRQVCSNVVPQRH